MAVGPQPRKFTWLLQSVTVRGTVQPGSIGGDTFDLNPDPEYAHILAMCPGYHCETYPEGTTFAGGPDQQVNYYLPWPILKKPGLQAFEVVVPSTGVRRPLADNDHVEIRGRLLIENGHPQNTSMRGLLQIGHVFIEVHPVDYLNITLVEDPTPGAVVRRTFVLVAPLYGMVYSPDWAANHVAGVAGNLFIEDDGRWFQNWDDNTMSIVAVPPPGVDPATTPPTVTETLRWNGTGQPLDAVRQVTQIPAGIQVHGHVDAPIAEQAGPVPIADINDPAHDKSVLILDYAVGWGDTSLVPYSFGRLWHAIRRPDGAWVPFIDISGPAGDIGPICAVAAAPGATAAGSVGTTTGSPGDVQVVALDWNGTLWHTIRHPDGTWQPFISMQGVGDIGPCFAVTASNGLPGEVQVCAAGMDGRLWHAIRHADSTWQSFNYMGGFGGPGPAGTPANGGIQALAAARDSTSVHYFVTTGDAHGTWLYHVRRYDNGGWSPMVDLKPNVGDIGVVRMVAASPGMNDSIQIVAVTGDGGLHHAILDAGGSWQPFADMKSAAAAGDPGPVTCVTGAMALDDDSVQWAVTRGDGALFHSIRFADGTWQQFQPMAPVTGQPGLSARITSACQGDGASYFILTV